MIINYKKNYCPWISSLTNKDKKLLDLFWKLFGDSYIVDPVSQSQAYYIMYIQTPWLLRKMLFKVEKNII